MSNGFILSLMAFLFLSLGYLGVPVAFALIAGVLAASLFTPISFSSLIGQLFHGIDAEALLAVPFFLLVGELMTSAVITQRMIVLSQTLVGHFRGGVAQVITLFSMFFAGISGSSTADVAVLSRTVAPEMDREGYDRGFTAALIASASTMANQWTGPVASGCRTSIAQPMFRGSPSQPGHPVRACSRRPRAS